jgi:Family of unknown function (DUF6282)
MVQSTFRFVASPIQFFYPWHGLLLTLIKAPGVNHGLINPMFRLTLLLACPALALAQTLSGVIDIHAHCDPDSRPRSIDAIDLAKLAKSRGYRGLVLKNHYEPTASLVYLVRKEVPGIELFGGIALNLTVGGVNPVAVERMTMVKGGWGRVVWMPTFDSENQVRTDKQDRPFVPVSDQGKLRPEVLQVLDLIAKHKLILATGHSSAVEDLMLIREAKKRGIEKIVVTHAMVSPIRMSVPQMTEAAQLGAYVEFVYNALIGPGREFGFADYARAIRAIGIDHAILASDLGQAGNPLHPDGFVEYLKGMRANGFSVTEIDQMAKVNPARLLGLE